MMDERGKNRSEERTRDTAQLAPAENKRSRHFEKKGGKKNRRRGGEANNKLNIFLHLETCYLAKRRICRMQRAWRRRPKRPGSWEASPAYWQAYTTKKKRKRKLLSYVDTEALIRKFPRNRYHKLIISILKPPKRNKV